MRESRYHRLKHSKKHGNCRQVIRRPGNELIASNDWRAGDVNCSARIPARQVVFCFVSLEAAIMEEGLQFWALARNTTK